MYFLKKRLEITIVYGIILHSVVIRRQLAESTDFAEY